MHIVGSFSDKEWYIGIDEQSLDRAISPYPADNYIVRLVIKRSDDTILYGPGLQIIPPLSLGLDVHSCFSGTKLY